MIRIAVVEDEEKALEELLGLLERYQKEKQEIFDIKTYKNAVIFLTNYQPNYDLIFMDIQMPYMDGMQAAARLRELDTETCLIFVTNLANMAVKGYEVSAFDFVVKPVQYNVLFAKMNRTLDYLMKSKNQKIQIQSAGVRRLIQISDIIYVEVSNHQLVYHTENGDYEVYGTMAKTRSQLEQYGFSLCNNCYLVNLHYVKNVEKYLVVVKDKELQISHPKKKTFMEALNNFIGG